MGPLAGFGPSPTGLVLAVPLRRELGEIGMIAALICVVSLAALAQVFVSYCRSVLATARKVDLSDRLLEVADVGGRSLSADDFGRFMELVHLCPEHKANRAGVREILTYYRSLNALNRLFGGMISGLAAWTERERERCSHFAAVVLDRSISTSRNLFSEQAGD
jgi:hypothetical protein